MVSLLTSWRGLHRTKCVSFLTFRVCQIKSPFGPTTIYIIIGYTLSIYRRCTYNSHKTDGTSFLDISLFYNSLLFSVELGIMKWSLPFISVFPMHNPNTCLFLVNTTKTGAPAQSSLANASKPLNATKKNVSVKEEGKPSINGRYAIMFFYLNKYICPHLDSINTCVTLDAYSFREAANIKSLLRGLMGGGGGG